MLSQLASANPGSSHAALAFREQEEDLTKRLMTKQDGADIKAEIIKWMFLFWVGQIAVLMAAAKFLFGI